MPNDKNPSRPYYGPEAATAPDSSPAKTLPPLLSRGEPCKGKEHQHSHNWLSVVPATDAHAKLITEMLIPTKTQFWNISKRAPPKTTKTQCYRCQLHQIQRAFDDWVLKPKVPRCYMGVILIGLKSVDPQEALWNQPWRPDVFGPIMEFENLGSVQTDGENRWGGKKEYLNKNSGEAQEVEDWLNDWWILDGDPGQTGA